MTKEEIAKELRQWAKAIEPRSDGLIRVRLEKLAAEIERLKNK